MNTRKKVTDIILNALRSINEWIAADDLYIYLRTHSVSIGYSTLYKHLKAMRESDLIQVNSSEKKILYLA